MPPTRTSIPFATRCWSLLLLSSISLVLANALVIPTKITEPSRTTILAAASRVPTNDILFSAAATRSSGNAANVGATHTRNDDNEELPSFLGGTIIGTSHAIVDTDPADRSRSIRRFSATIKKKSPSSSSRRVPVDVDGDASTSTTRSIGTLFPSKKISPKNFLSKFVPKTQARIVKTIAIAATISSLMSFGRRIDNMNSNNFEHLVLDEAYSQAALMSNTDPITPLPANTKIRGGTALSVLNNAEEAAAPREAKDDVVLTGRRGGGQISATAAATHTATFQSYDELSPTTKHTIEVICKAAVIIAGVGVGVSMKPQTPRKMKRRKATKTKAGDKMKASIISLASTLERSIKSGTAKTRREEKVHRSLLEAQLRYAAADLTRKRLDDMTNQFQRLRDEHNKLQRSSSDSKTTLEDDLNSATMRLALAETSASGLSLELKRLTGIEMTLRKEVDQLRAQLDATTKESRDTQISLGADLKNEKQATKSLKEEIEKLKEEVEDQRKNLKEKQSAPEIEEVSFAPAVDEIEVEVEPTTTGNVYGKPYLPLDIEENDDVKNALQAIKTEGLNVENLKLLEPAGTADAATLTLTGYKGGGPASKQVNQDRAVIVSPFFIGGGEEPSSDNNCLMCVFDGHNADGEIVSEFATRALPDILSRKLKDLNGQAEEKKWDDACVVEETKKVLATTFVEVHRTGQTELATNAGGCTASVVLQLGDKVYVANAGDTQSVVATYAEETGDITVAYVTREDTPDLDDELERIEKQGGIVQYVDGSSRVIYFDENDVACGGLAISRALGDWDLNDYGVIPDPIVDVIDLKDITDGDSDSKVQVFAVAASDGLLEFIDRSDFLCRSVEGLYVSDKPNIFSSIEEMILGAKKGWFLECGDEYRDDITCAVTKLSL